MVVVTKVVVDVLYYQKMFLSLLLASSSEFFFNLYFNFNLWILNSKKRQFLEFRSPNYYVSFCQIRDGGHLQTREKDCPFCMPGSGFLMPGGHFPISEPSREQEAKCTSLRNLRSFVCGQWAPSWYLHREQK